MTTPKKKLIEVALPLEAINKASERESYIYRGNPSAVHKWWAQRPLAAARAVLFAQLVDDPSARPDLFPTERAQEKERQRLFCLIERLVQWESTNDERTLQEARDAIWESWRRSCAENVDHPQARTLFDRYNLPPFHDPFAGGGTLPLEAQRLGLRVSAGDLNPVAVLINKSLLDFPARFAGRQPINPSAQQALDAGAGWAGARGLMDDVKYYAQVMGGEAETRLRHLYSDVAVTAAMARGRADLRDLVGRKLQVIAWLWARTVKSPNPAFAQLDVPLASTFVLSSKAGKEAYVEPSITDSGYRFEVKVGKPPQGAKQGTKLSRGANFRCLMSNTPIEPDYVKAEGKAGRMGTRLLAAVAKSTNGRVYLSPTEEMETAARVGRSGWAPDGALVEDPRAFTPVLYGLANWKDLFTDRQLAAMDTLTGLISEIRDRVEQDAIRAGSSKGVPLREGGNGAVAYAEAVAVYLAFAVSKMSDYNCSLVPWYTKEDRPGHLFSQQVVPMVWDFAELNPLSDIGGGFSASSSIVAEAIRGCAPRGVLGRAIQQDAVAGSGDANAVISTDPPYYDNVPYADLSDFFYVWLRRSLKTSFPDLFATVTAPKSAELVATPYRHGGKREAEAFFLEGMTEAMHRIAETSHPGFPVTIYYAFKQTESEKVEGAGVASTGWDTFLEAVIRSGFAINGTWPMRTERGARSRGIGSNALASSVVLVCRPRASSPRTATRREFIACLEEELPRALTHLQRGNIAPVDLAQAAIGPGMAVYTRYSQVLDAAGRPVSVREALALINEVLDESLAEQEGDFDSDTRWALAWFEQVGFSDGEFGVAETLSKAKNTSVKGLEEAGILKSSRGRVRLLRPSELPSDWDPATDSRLTAWEVVHHLVRALDAGGEFGAAGLVAELGAKAEVARELAYRLYTLCERKKRASEALAYNALIQSWPEISRLAREGKEPGTQGGLFDKGEE